jgi:hypothetical protein
VIELSTSVGRRRLKLGEGFRVNRSAALHAELDALLGHAIVSDGDGARLDEPAGQGDSYALGAAASA